MPAKPPKAQISPSQAAVMVDLMQEFEFLLNGKTQIGVRWAIDAANKNVGTIQPNGSFKATPDPPHDSGGILHGTLPDGTTADAKINIQINWGSLNPGPILVDDWSAWQAGIPGTLWNDARGRRAWLTMMDILHQLPSSFLKMVGNICMVRSQEVFWGGKKSNSIHWPFDRRATIYPNNFINALDLGEDLTANAWFAKIFLHELAHAVLANKAFGGGDRFFRALAGAVGWLAVPFMPLTVPAGILLSPLSIFSIYTEASRDFLSDYADATGWVINAVKWGNPFLGMLLTQSPDVVTGLQLVGQNPLVHLRNIHLPDKFTAGDLAKAGFPPDSDPLYPATDVHEDWACSLTYLAFNPDWEKKFPQFKTRAEFFYKHKIWKPGDSVKCGGYLNKWAESKGNKPPDARKWAVHFGSYAGKVPKSNPKPKPAVNKIKGFSIEKVADQVPEDDTESYLGEGGAQVTSENPFQDDFKELQQQAVLFAKYQEADDHFIKIMAPVLAPISSILSALDISPRDGSAMEFLRIAEVHGDGVKCLDADTKAAGYLIGDFVMDSNAEVWIVVEVDGAGNIKRVAGNPSTENRAPKNLAYNLKLIKYTWRMQAAKRTWPLNPNAKYRDLDKALTSMIMSWGQTASAGKRDLSLPANLLAQLLDAANLIIPQLTPRSSDWSLDRIKDFCAGYGAGIKIISSDAVPVAGDVVCLSGPDRLGVMTRAKSDNGGPDALVNGGDKIGLVGEDQDAAKLIHGFKSSTIKWFWSPSNEKKV